MSSPVHSGHITHTRKALQLEVGAEDSYGNSVPPMATANGRQWTVIRDCSGEQLKQTGQATSSTEVQVVNGLTQGAIRADIYRGGKLLATKTGVAPQQQAVFEFKPVIWLGVVSPFTLQNIQYI